MHSAQALVLCSITVLACAADPVGPWAWSRGLHNPAAPATSSIGRDGSIESAALLSGSAASGVVRTLQWSGDNQAGGRSIAFNSFVGAPQRNYFVGLAGSEIVKGGDASGSFVFSRHLSQDAHLRLAFVAATPAALVAAHGSGFGLAGVLPWNGIVVNLSFRNDTTTSMAWQSAALAGNPVEVGVWQVPAGSTLAQAQAVAANRLARLSVLTDETRPTLLTTAKLQVQAGGAWQVLLDLGGDGTIDIDLVGGQDGNALYTLPNLDESSGLVVTTVAAGGARVGEVGRTRIDMAFTESPSSAPPVPGRNRRPLTVRAPLQSATSPAHIEADRWSTSQQMTISGPSGTLALRVAERLAWTGLPLRQGGTTAWTARQSGTPETVQSGVVEWVPTLVQGTRTIEVRTGDRLWLRMPVAGSFRIEEDGVVVRPEQAVAAGAETVQEFTSAGIIHVIARNTAGTQIADLEIVSYDVDLSRPSPCQLGFEVQLDVGFEPRTRGSRVVFAGNDPKLAVREIAAGSGTKRLGVRPTAAGQLQLLARLGSPTGPIIASNEVQEFRMLALDRDAFLIDPVDRTGRQRLRMEPFVANQRLTFQMSGSRSSFKGGATSFTVTTGDAQTSLGEPGFRIEPALPGVEPAGVFDYEVVVPVGETAHCHSILFTKGDGYYSGVLVPTNPN